MYLRNLPEFNENINFEWDSVLYFCLWSEMKKQLMFFDGCSHSVLRTFQIFNWDFVQLIKKYKLNE